MLAQWVPLHAVSCSNLIETGGCAESREIPLRVTQTCSGCCTRDPPLSLSVLRPELRGQVARRSRSRAVGRTLLFRSSEYMPTAYWSTITLVPPHIQERAFSREARAQDCGSRSSERPRSFARISDRRKSPTIVSLYVAENCLVDILRLRTLDPAGRIVRDVFSDLSP